jgi:FKBP-type peptidyl-prolyl cis-trans isomerase
MKKEKIITVFTLVALVVVLGFVISAIGKPGGNIVKNLTEPPKNELPSEVAPQKFEIKSMPGDEKLVKKDIIVGTGVEAKAGDTLSVNYIGVLEDGTKFDSSYDRNEPLEFILGSGQLIRGWEIGILGMKVGGKRELIIPPELGYGLSGKGPIPPNATLKFTIELLSVKNIESGENINFNL